MTAVMKYAGALGLDELEAEVRRGFRKAARRSSLTPGTVGVQENTVPALRRDTVSHSALLRFGAINLAGFALLGAAWARGWIDVVVAADQTGMTFAIFGVFIAGLVICGAKLWRTGREMIAAQSALPGGGTWTSDYLTDIGGRDSGARAIMASTLRLRLSDWIAVIRHFANSLVLLGLIGTVIGFIIALSGVDPSVVSDVKAISPMVSQLLAGMAVALYTTLAGAVLNLWLMVNFRLISGATARLITCVVERGEDDECA
tara:strand:+ start:24072 stop:24848 length:777 start_codon:yes stop_codon:yes gene_type:complete